MWKNAFVLTLSDDGLPHSMRLRPFKRVGGVTGRAGPGETMAVCAIRQAEQKLSARIRLLPAPETFFHDRERKCFFPIGSNDPYPPFLLERRKAPVLKRSSCEEADYDVALYLAQVVDRQIIPGEDVDGLLLAPLARWDRLKGGPKLGQLLSGGFRVISRRRTRFSTRIWMPWEETLITARFLMNGK
ncbi:MAG: hypothetical protein WBZ33_15165, partial [Thermoactinomyces sp.]